MSDLSACVDFLQRLIGTQSLPGEEGEIAALVRSEMESLGYQDVRADEAGNVIGRVPGRGEAEPLMFNTHLDHVDVGDPGAWPHPPYGGEIYGGRVWGRGAVDIKGPLAAQVYGVARLLRNGVQPAGDVYVTAAVQEEVGGLGARHMVTYMQPPVVVVGEPSGNTLRRGHRGRTELILHAVGRSVHASVPQEGVNALDVVANFVLGLHGLKMREDPDLGTSTVVASLIRTDQTSANVVPGEAWLTCDWRNVPGESGDDSRRALETIAAASLVDGARAEVIIPTYERVSYTGMKMEIPANNPAYVLPEDHAAVLAALEILQRALGEDVPLDVWRFATDGGHFSLAGQTCIGIGPGDELLAHTINESIAIDEIEVALKANEALAHELNANVLPA
ncbi:MAG: M20 family metallopeptidase [Acidobacteriota bacterium]